jgi:hypothetical protein
MGSMATKVGSLLRKRLDSYPSDGSTTDQLMVDLAVIVLSNMRSCEVDTALFMSLGYEGVAELLASRIGDSNE